MNGDCCLFFASASQEREPLAHCDAPNCLNRAVYKTSCEHPLCKKHTIRLGSNSTPDDLRWICLNQMCQNQVDETAFTLISSNQNRTYEQITGGG